MNPRDEIINKAIGHERLSPKEALWLMDSQDLPLLGYLVNLMYPGHGVVSFQENRTVTLRKIGQDTKFEEPRSTSCRLDSHGFQDITETTYRVEIGSAPGETSSFNDLMTGIQTIKKQFHNIGRIAVSAAEILTCASSEKEDPEKILERFVFAGISEITSDLLWKNNTWKEKGTPDAFSLERLVSIHEAAHKSALRSTLSMHYGRDETLADRVGLLTLLRDMQDRSKGICTFIPMPIREPSDENSPQRGDDDVRTIAISRLFLDNFENIGVDFSKCGIDISQSKPLLRKRLHVTQSWEELMLSNMCKAHHREQLKQEMAKKMARSGEGLMPDLDEEDEEEEAPAEPEPELEKPIPEPAQKQRGRPKKKTE
ncbi:MAG: hypothetical protein HQK54_09750, partial [Oligoflexales bacterium]|nr:hypothetical protein [Oligoflexales bacterium]